MSKTNESLTKLRDHSDEELTALLATTRDELFRLKLGQYTNQVTSTAGMVTKRRDIARILTVLNGRKAGTEKQAQKSAEAAPATAEAAPAKKSSKKKKAE
ncbi:MAG: 50S ribosomal protein L29 [Kofleriaceae bacterium]